MNGTIVKKCKHNIFAQITTFSFYYQISLRHYKNIPTKIPRDNVVWILIKNKTLGTLYIYNFFIIILFKPSIYIPFN